MKLPHQSDVMAAIEIFPLMRADTEGGDCVIDAVDVSRFSASMAQLLVSKAKTMGESGRTMTIINQPESFRQDLVDMGLSEYLMGRNENV